MLWGLPSGKIYINENAGVGVCLLKGFVEETVMLGWQFNDINDTNLPTLSGYEYNAFTYNPLM